MPRMWGVERVAPKSTALATGAGGKLSAVGVWSALAWAVVWAGAGDLLSEAIVR
jgi:hypothetical protein